MAALQASRPLTIAQAASSLFQSRGTGAYRRRDRKGGFSAWELGRHHTHMPFRGRGTSSPLPVPIFLRPRRRQ